MSKLLPKIVLIFTIIISFTSFLCWAQKTKGPAPIICDLGGVLIDTNHAASFWYIGPWRYLYYVACSWPQTKSTRRLLYQTFNQLTPRDSNETEARDSVGTLLPQLMCDWLKGTASPASILTFIKEQFQKHPEYFANPAERSLMQGIATLLFDPEIFIDTRMIIPEGLRFIQECKAKGHPLYLLSNWDPTSFAILKKRFPELFDYFDGILISGDCGLLKPDSAIFHLLLKTYNLNPYQCIYLDDQKENLITAQKIGIRSILIQPQSGLLSSSPDFSPAQYALNQ